MMTREYRQIFRQRMAQVLEWSAVDKSLGLVAVLMLHFCQYVVWSLYALQHSQRDRLIQVDAVHSFMLVHAVVLGLGLLLLASGAWLRQQTPESRAFQHLTLHYYAISLVTASYAIGTVSFCAGIVLLGAPIFGFILMDRRAVWLASISALTLLAILSYAAAFGVIPYAPVVVPPVDAVGRLFWMNSLFFFAAPFLLILPVLADQMLMWWREREARIRQMSRTDALTGLPNRRHILEQAEAAASRTARTGEVFTLAVLDLDHFKSVNDTWGHPVGDAVLRAAAYCLREHLRQGDLVGRFGGEEFLVLLPATPATTAVEVLERLRQALRRLVIDNGAGGQLGISASFGAAIHGMGDELQHSICRADEALYAAKTAGRDRVVLA